MRRAKRGIGDHFSSSGAGGTVVQPVLEPVHVVEHVAHVVLGVLVLGAPEEGVEGADLDADPAVHAEGVVDVEPVERRAHPDPAPRLVWLLLLLVALDVDAPVGALAGAQSMQTVHASWSRAMTPRARGTGVSLTTG